MRNIPVFTTEFGVASLILKEIPYKGTAYVRLQSSLYPEKPTYTNAGYKDAIMRSFNIVKYFEGGNES